MSLETATTILAFATIGLALATIALAVIAGYQISSIREESRKERTLEACNRYDLNPVIRGATRRLRKAINSGAYKANRGDHKVDVIELFNYLEALAIGIEQGLYIDDLARDHMEDIIKGHMDEILTSEEMEKLGLGRDDFRCLFKLRKRWDSEERAVVRYREWR
jgi:hypothetical protein